MPSLPPLPRRLAAAFALMLALATAATAQTVPVQAVEFDAPSVGRKMKFNIALPKGYEDSEKRYPVLYLLHGLTGNYQNWARMGGGLPNSPVLDVKLTGDGRTLYAATFGRSVWSIPLG